MTRFPKKCDITWFEFLLPSCRQAVRTPLVAHIRTVQILDFVVISNFRCNKVNNTCPQAGALDQNIDYTLGSNNSDPERSTQEIYAYSRSSIEHFLGRVKLCRYMYSKQPNYEILCCTTYWRTRLAYINETQNEYCIS